MSHKQLKKIKLKVHGTHCASCEVLIERKFKKIEGVEKVNVNHATGKAEIHYSNKPDIAELEQAIKDDGYTVSWWHERNKVSESGVSNTQKDYLQIGAIFLIIVAVYVLLKHLDLVPKLGVTENMSYGFVFLIGLVAAMSTCLAVTGGLLMAVAAKHNQQHPGLNSVQRFKPHLYFNIGRLVSYTVLGAAIGSLGSVLTLSPQVNGIVTVIASLVMVGLGFQLLKLFPGLRRFQPKMPKAFAHKVHELSDQHQKSAPFLLGAGTFFLPCGFTQALQLYVLSQGDPMTGALTMLFFSLGTLPALLSLSAISSFAKGAAQGYFLKFAGVMVIMLGLFNVNNGLTLAGSSVTLSSLWQRPSKNVVQAVSDPNIKLVNGKQIVQMKVVGLTYSPHQFTILQGVPVEWQIDGTQAEGCAQVVTVPKLGITEYLPPGGVKTIQFTPQEVGTIPFHCSMAMTTRGSAFTVVPNTQGIQGQPSSGAAPVDTGSSDCNPDIQNCVPAQKLSMTVTREQGFYPREFTVKKGTPVELIVDAKVPLGGCMSVLMIPQYDVTQQMKLGENKLAFTPTKTGVVPVACSMGSKMAQITVVN